MFEELLAKTEYDFLRTNEHLGDNIILLGLGGSYAYGTNIEGSDIDIRGIATNSKRELLTNENFEQFVNEETDTTIYSFNKMISLLCNCNPNTIEILGLRPEHYLHLTDIGKELLARKDMFLSKKAAAAFGGYATAQLRRLDNKSARKLTDELHEEHVLGSIKNAQYVFPERYFQYPEDAIKLYVDKAVNPTMESEIFADINLKHYPLRDYKCMWSDMHSIVKEYDKLGKRNHNAIEHNKLGKHMMHLIRLYLMCLDILEKGEIVTYREKEHDFLMDIRNGLYLDENSQPTKDFMDIVDSYEFRISVALEKTDLPKTPDYKKINDFVEEVNYSVIVK